MVVVRSSGSACLIHVAGALEDVVGSRPVPSLLEPVRDRLVVLEGVIEARPHSCLYQPVVDPLFCMVPPGPVSAQLYVSFFQLFLVEGRLSEVVDVGLDADVVEVPELYVDEGSKGKSSVEPVEVALT